MSDITKVAEQLNKRVSQLNIERSKQIGMQEAAKKQYESAIQAYEAKYGVKITPETLQEEYNKVYKDLNSDIEGLKSTIESIERGDFKKATEGVNIDLNPDLETIITEEKPVVQPQTPVDITSGMMTESINTNEVQQNVNFGVPYESVSKPDTKVVIEPINDVSKQEITQQEAPSFGGFEFGGIAEETPKEEKPVFEFGGLDLSGLGEQAQTQQAETQPQAQAQAAPSFDFSALVAGAEQQKASPVNNPMGGLSDTDFDDVGEEEQEVFSPEGWGTPKASEEINKNFADILNSSGLKFGE